MTQIEKNDGHTEPFDERKFYASILLTCREHSDPTAGCHGIAAAVTDTVAEQVADRESVMSTELRMLGRDALEEHSRTLADAFYVHDFERD